jgi:hypothetical protein
LPGRHAKRIKAAKGEFMGKKIIHPHPDPLPSREREIKVKGLYR